MLPAYRRLTTKDIRYMQKRRDMYYTAHFSFLTIPQYANRSYHQCSLHVPASIVRHAHHRHFCKRRMIPHIAASTARNTHHNGKYYKVFISFNKKRFESYTRSTDKKEYAAQLTKIAHDIFPQERAQYRSRPIRPAGYTKNPRPQQESFKKTFCHHT